MQFSIQGIEGIGQILPVFAAPDIEAQIIFLPLLGREKHKRLVDLSVDFVPGFKVEPGTQPVSPADAGDDGGDHTGTALQIIMLQQGVDQCAFS